MNINKENNNKRGGKRMKAIILAGGSATRLYPLTKGIPKALHAIYKAPMICYPLNILLRAGIRDILIIVSEDHSGKFINFLGPMLRRFGVRILSEVQEVPAGLPDAFILGEGFIGDDNVTLILGDNIFEDADTIANAIKNFESGGHIFAKEVDDPERFGVATVDSTGKVTNIVEKPENPESNLAVTGAYIYDSRVVEEAKKLKPSGRKELEIVDLHNFYLQKGELKLSKIQGAWLDAGTPDALLEAQNLAKEKGLYEKFDPILLQAIEEGRKRFKEAANRMLGK